VPVVTAAGRCGGGGGQMTKDPSTPPCLSVCVCGDESFTIIGISWEPEGQMGEDTGVTHALDIRRIIKPSPMADG
jgi:hypothetical protein